MLQFNPYEPSDRDQCLRLFQSNVPRFFHPSEEAEYETYLDQHAPGNYWCALQDGSPVGCGGIRIRPDGIGRLVWGMIHRDHHRQGLGQALLQFRLRQLAESPEVKIIQLETSQYNPGFFRRFGFSEFKKTEDLYGPGLDSHEMEFKMTDEVRARLLEKP